MEQSIAVGAVAAMVAAGLLLAGCASSDAALRAQVAAGDVARHLDVRSGPAACRDAIGRQAVGSAALDGAEIRITSWNVRKGQAADWHPDYVRLSDGADLVLMQEAELSEERIGELDAERHWSFAPGYQSGRGISGVMTLSSIQPLTHCSLVSIEPVLGTPKATAITQYAIHGSAETLVVVNVHAVNFSFGLKAFTDQFNQIEEALADHYGPVIVSGDFNTWRPARSRVVDRMATRLGLTPVLFPEDNRKRFWGQPLDHVYVRGLTATAAGSPEVTTSDHNPLSVTLKL